MNAGDRFFVDTNVILYTADPADPAKQARCRRWLTALWESGAGCISWQVLHEFYANATRKMRLPNSQAKVVVEVFALWQPVEASLGLVQRGWYWMETAQLSYWESLIVSAAERCGCSVLLTDDLQEGRKLGDVTVINPFHSSPDDFHFRKR